MRVEIVMYHYIRNFKNSKYPNLKGLDIREFEEQLKFFSNNYNIISAEKLKRNLLYGENIPERSMILTFDDGYKEHFDIVYPLLLKNNMKAFFSMPGKILDQNHVLDVNKIHFILATTKKEKILEDIFRELDYYRGREFTIDSNDELYRKYAIKNRFDDGDIIFIKRLLQKELDYRLRTKILKKLFEKYVSNSEKDFCKELYMNYGQIRAMRRSGMEFGIHGYSHEWLTNMSTKSIKYEIERSLNIFDGVIDREEWIMCYPFGDYNDEVIKYISQNGCKMGFSTQVKILDTNRYNMYALPRLDTNDYPPKSNKFIKIREGDDVYEQV